MTAIDKGQKQQQGSRKKSLGASPSLDELVEAKGSRKAGGDTLRVSRENSGNEAELSEKKSDQSNVVRWLQLLAAVGIPLVLVYLAFAGLVNPQFAELRELIASNRELISSNREAIAANTSSIERLEAKIDSSVARLEARIDLIAEVLILTATNENITEAELRNLLNAGEE